MTQASEPSSQKLDEAAKPRMKQRWLIIILALTFLFVLMPFLFWQATWFGRPLNDVQLEAALQGRDRPRDIQHGLSQLADRILAPNQAARDSARRFYPDVLRIAETGGDELRLTAAWVMGQDNSVPEFHAGLLKLLQDPNPMVRRNAALALIRFGDASGLGEIRATLQPYSVSAPQDGKLLERLKPDDGINPGTLLGRIETGQNEMEMRSQVPGSVQRWLVADGMQVTAGEPVLVVEPSTAEVWEALRALYLIGQKQDLPSVEQLSQNTANIPADVRRQAELTARAIKSRSGE